MQIITSAIAYNPIGWTQLSALDKAAGYDTKPVFAHEPKVCASSSGAAVIFLVYHTVARRCGGMHVSAARVPHPGEHPTLAH